jgi:hypothetical protein
LIARIRGATQTAGMGTHRQHVPPEIREGGDVCGAEDRWQRVRDGRRLSRRGLAAGLSHPSSSSTFSKMAARIPHSLSYFDPATRRWVAVLSKTIQRAGAQSLVKTKPIKPLFDIVSWNVDYWNNQAHRRCLGLIDHVLERGAPDILCLQEVRPDVRDSLLGNRTIREAGRRTPMLAWRVRTTSHSQP